jgi:hypothetical protein
MPEGVMMRDKSFNYLENALYLLLVSPRESQIGKNTEFLHYLLIIGVKIATKCDDKTY